MLATKDNAGALFNGRDLTGWTGDSQLWSVENGEIVGRSPGLEHNTFLVSDLHGGRFPAVARREARERRRQQRRAVPHPVAQRLRRNARLPGRHRRRLVGQALRRERPGTVVGQVRARSSSRRASGTTTRFEPSASHIRTWLNGQPCVDLVRPDRQAPRHLRAANPRRRPDGSPLPQSAAWKSSATSRRLLSRLDPKQLPISRASSAEWTAAGRCVRDEFEVSRSASHGDQPGRDHAPGRDLQHSGSRARDSSKVPPQPASTISGTVPSPNTTIVSQPRRTSPVLAA